MMRLLNIEWNKTFYNKGTRIFIILYFVLIAGMGLILPNIKPNLNGIEVNFIKMGALEFPIIWHVISWLIGFGKFFLAIIIINNITNEYSFGTIKQNVIDGFSKGEFFASKILMTFMLSLFSTLLVAAIVLILGNVYSENHNVFDGSAYILGYFIEIFGYLIIAMFLSFLLKKSAFAILLLIVWSFAETILKGVEFLARFGTSNADIEANTDPFLFTSYLPFNVNSTVVDYPSLSIQNFLMSGKLFTPVDFDWMMSGIAVIYMIIFVGLSYTVLKKRDL